jgi:hypothetical protein
MNGEVCCILGVCCPPGSVGQVNSLATELVKAKVCDEVNEAHAIAAWIYENFDLGPKGLVQPLLKAGHKLHRAAEV